MELKKIGILSFAKITTIFGLVMGLIASIFLTILQKIQSALPLNELSEMGVEPIQLSVTVILTLLLYYIVIGFVSGVIIAVIYNLTSKYFGGVKIELKK